MTNERFTKTDRLLAGGEFERVYARRRRASDQWLAVFVCENEAGRPRLGMSVSRRVGKAVLRNRWKRRIREAFRTQRAELPDLDVIVSPRGGEPPSMEVLAGALVALVRQAARKLHM